MPIYSYAIGTSNPPTNVESLATPLNPPRGRFYENATVVNLLDGSVAARGSPFAVWRFDILTQEMVTQLRTICPGDSADVFITTRILDGTFDTFSGIMIWPRQQMDARTFKGRHLGLEFTFRKLVAV